MLLTRLPGESQYSASCGVTLMRQMFGSSGLSHQILTGIDHNSLIFLRSELISAMPETETYFSAAGLREGEAHFWKLANLLVLVRPYVREEIDDAFLALDKRSHRTRTEFGAVPRGQHAEPHRFHQIPHVVDSHFSHGRIPVDISYQRPAWRDALVGSPCLSPTSTARCAAAA